MRWGYWAAGLDSDGAAGKWVAAAMAGRGRGVGKRERPYISRTGGPVEDKESACVHPRPVRFDANATQIWARNGSKMDKKRAGVHLRRHVGSRFVSVSP